MPNSSKPLQRIRSFTQLLTAPNSPKKKAAKIAPKQSPRIQHQQEKEKLAQEKEVKMRQHEVILEDQQLGDTEGAQGNDNNNEANANIPHPQKKDSSTSSSTVMAQMRRPKSGPAKKWTSAFRVVQSMTRWKNMGKRHHYPNGEGGGSRGSSFSDSNESTPTRTFIGGGHEHEEIIDPVYLALKQATAKYGMNGGNGGGGGANGSRTGSRRGSQCALAHNPIFDSDTPSPRNLSQTSLQDSGYSGGGGGGMAGSRSRLVSGSTPHLHGVGSAKGNNINNTIGGGGGGTNQNGQPHQQQQQQGGQAGGGGSGAAQQISGAGGRRPKLSEKMKSLSLDCEGMPAMPVQSGLGRNQYYNKPTNRSSTRPFAPSGDSFEDAIDRSISPPPRPMQPRRLPPAPNQQAQSAAAAARQPLATATTAQNGMPTTTAVMPTTQTISTGVVSPVTSTATPASVASTLPIGTHIVIHEYLYGDCCLYLGDRLVVVDNGDPDWNHGFKVNDRLEQLYTFPNTCVAAFQPDEQPMRLIQNCNLVEQKLRLYRDQIIFVQPDSLRDDGRVLVRNEHGKFAYCPLQFLMLM